MPAYKMLLCPVESDCGEFTSGALADALAEAGLIGPPISLPRETIYPTGEHFLQLVTFLGCSPRIELDPPADAAQIESDSRAGRFCHIVLSGTEHGLQFRADEQAAPPRCPACRQPETGWRERIEAWRETGTLDWTCPSCGHQGSLASLNFRKQGGFGRGFVEIRGIFPSEAVPVPALLDRLEALAGCRWRALYIKE